MQDAQQLVAMSGCNVWRSDSVSTRPYEQRNFGSKASIFELEIGIGIILRGPGDGLH